MVRMQGGCGDGNAGLHGLRIAGTVRGGGVRLCRLSCVYVTFMVLPVGKAGTRESKNNCNGKCKVQQQLLLLSRENGLPPLRRRPICGTPGYGPDDTTLVLWENGGLAVGDMLSGLTCMPRHPKVAGRAVFLRSGNAGTSSEEAITRTAWRETLREEIGAMIAASLRDPRIASCHVSEGGAESGREVGAGCMWSWTRTYRRLRKPKKKPWRGWRRPRGTSALS